jgi:hypothetical protein
MKKCRKSFPQVRLWKMWKTCPAFCRFSADFARFSRVFHNEGCGKCGKGGVFPIPCKLHKGILFLAVKGKKWKGKTVKKDGRGRKQGIGVVPYGKPLSRSNKVRRR